MWKVWKSQKFKTNRKQKQCPIRKFSLQPSHDYPIHEKDGAVLVSLNSPERKAGADKCGQNLPEIELCQKDQDEAHSKQKLSPHTIHVIQAKSTFQGVEKGVNVENGAAKNDVHDTFLPRKNNQDIQNLNITTDEKAVVSTEPEKKEDTNNPGTIDACTRETRDSRQIVVKKSVKKDIFSRKKKGENQNGKKIVPVNQQQEEKHGKGCWGAKYKDPSKTDNTVNKPVSNDTKVKSKKIPFWKRNKQDHIGKKVAPTEQEQGDKDDGQVFDGDSNLVKEGENITATTTPMLADAANVPSSKSMEVISRLGNGTHIHNHYHIYGETHIHNHGLELYRNKTYTYSAPNGILSTGNSSKNTVTNNGRNASQPTRRGSL
ncbi:hypothetical protein CHS0354_001389 [Potamilus streckersoni]|uniref:Uncharacterized protein n=1 Tax=Potamilus streckersoni TaxID=2493646 RepID=A0AAE0T7P2_9BIVA|nr:hypothetical protein CHS0354_001389 [Potamilus streckersoni]